MPKKQSAKRVVQSPPPVMESPPELSLAVISELAAVANEHRQRFAAGDDLTRLYLLQALAVARVVTEHFVPDARNRRASEVLYEIRDVLARMSVTDPVAAGWREYAWRAMQLGTASTLFAGVALAAPTMLGPSMLADPGAYADLRGELRLSDAAVNQLGELFTLMDVEHWRAAIGVLRGAIPPPAANDSAGTHTAKRKPTKKKRGRPTGTSKYDPVIDRRVVEASAAGADLQSLKRDFGMTKKQIQQAKARHRRRVERGR